MAYSHAFVLLAAASAQAANRPGADQLLSDAMRVNLQYFWDPAAGMVRESYDRRFAVAEDYRGINANMHTVEAYLAAADVTGDRAWLERATAIVSFVVEQARQRYWRIAEHYDSQWQAREEYHRDQPDHPFRPFGVTPGHGLEWSRLMVQLWASWRAISSTDYRWILSAAHNIFERARVDGWRRDGAAGFVYTTDFAGQPVVHQRMHWVVCEAIQAAVALRSAAVISAEDNAAGTPSGGAKDIAGGVATDVAADVAADPPVFDNGAVSHFEHHYRSWVDYAHEYLLRPDGAWHHELDQQNRVATTVWDGVPDIYHASGAVLAARLPLQPFAACAIGAGLLR